MAPGERERVLEQREGGVEMGREMGQEYRKERVRAPQSVCCLRMYETFQMKSVFSIFFKTLVISQ